MSIRLIAVPTLVVVAIAATAVSGCHDGKGVRTTTTKVTVTGTPKAGYAARQPTPTSGADTAVDDRTATGSGSRP